MRFGRILGDVLMDVEPEQAAVESFVGLISERARSREIAIGLSGSSPPTPAPARAATVHAPRRAIEVFHPDGPIAISPLNLYRRLPAYEALAHADGVPIVEAWSIVHEGRALRAACGPLAPERFALWLNVTERCPIRRLGLYAHEREHIRRGDHTLAPRDWQAQEGACEAAAVHDVADWAAVAATRAGLAVDAETCVACYQGGHVPCPQGAATLEAVTRALAPL